MFTRSSLALSVVWILGILTVAGAETIEVNPYRAGGLHDEWTMTPEESGDWILDEDILYGEARKSRVSEAIFTAEGWDEFTLFLQVDDKVRKTKLLLVPAAEGEERVEIDFKKKWIDRRADWTRMRLVVKDQVAALYSADDDESELASFKVPAGKIHVGFQLKRGGRVKLKHIRVVYERPPEPKAEVPAGFRDILAEGVFEQMFAPWQHPEQSTPGEWTVAGGRLKAKNAEPHGSSKMAVRLLRGRIADYELRFKLKSGARDFQLLAHLGDGGAGTQKAWTLDGYLTGAGPWHTFIVKYADGRLSMNVNGLDVVAGDQTVGGTTPIGFLLRANGQAELKDLHIKSSQIRPSAGPPPGAQQPGGGGGDRPAETPPMFNGKDLEGWMPRPEENVWKVVGGAIFGMNQSGSVASLVWRYSLRGDYKLTFKVEAGARGLAVVTKLNSESRQTSRVVIPDKALDQDWNECEVVVRGAQATLKVNGKQVAAEAAVTGTGFTGFVMAPGGVARLKDLAIGAP
jgi:hypothetical protein